MPLKAPRALQSSSVELENHADQDGLRDRRSAWRLDWPCRVAELSSQKAASSMPSTATAVERTVVSGAGDRSERLRGAAAVVKMQWDVSQRRQPLDLRGSLVAPRRGLRSLPQRSVSRSASGLPVLP